MSRYLQLKMPRQKTKITVDVNAPEAEIIRQLNAFMPSMLSGYPSNLSLLADYEELEIRPDVIITGGELLTDEIREKLTDRVIVHDEPCKCGKRSRWLEIEGRTDDILEFAKGVKIAPMSLYKMLEEVRSIRRFQLVQRAPDTLELRLIAGDREAAFEEARRDSFRKHPERDCRPAEANGSLITRKGESCR